MISLIRCNSCNNTDNRNPKRPTLSYPLISGLDYILGHFKQDTLFPRKISTKLTQGKQVIVYSRTEALEHFAMANLLDCKISAYPAKNWRKGLYKLVEPNFLFIDLDLSTSGSMISLSAALETTLANIKEMLGGIPTVIWSGNGYHIYQPVDALVLEEQEVFSKFEQPSRRLVQFAEQYLSDNKMDHCHNHTISLNNCMVRIPGSYNSKSQTPKEVAIVQRWDGTRPSINPLLFGCYIYLQDRRFKGILKSQSNCEYSHLTYVKGKSCHYLRRR